MTIYRYEMTIPVKVVSALHSGGVDEAPEREYVDEDGRTAQPNEFVRNGLGEAVLPGRSLKGAVRAAFEEHAVALGFADPGGRVDEPALKSLWGGELRRHVGASKQQRGMSSDADLPLRASALTFHHAVVWTDGALPHRMSTAIDRAWGSAADGALFSYEYLPVGTTFELRISAEARDGDDAIPTTPRRNEAGAPSADHAQSKTGGDNSTKPAAPEQVEKALRAIVTLFKDGVISLGGRTGSGWGRVELDASEVNYTKGQIPQASRKPGGSVESVLKRLVGEETAKVPLRTDGARKAPEPLAFTLDWTSPSGVFVGIPMPKVDPKKKDEKYTTPNVPVRNWRVDDGFLRTHGEDTYPDNAHADEAALLLPGSSIRGALRSRCLRIAHDLVDAEDVTRALLNEDGTSKGVHQQITAEPNLVRYLFGSTEHRGAVRVLDCEGRVEGATMSNGSPEEIKVLELTRNAIDRVTGSAAHSALFSELLYPKADWSPIRIEVDQRQLDQNILLDLRGRGTITDTDDDRAREDPSVVTRSHASLLLLALAVSELCEGTLPLGGGTGGGLGAVQVSEVAVTIPAERDKAAKIPFTAPEDAADSNSVRDARESFAQSFLHAIQPLFALPDAPTKDGLSAEDSVLAALLPLLRDNKGGSANSKTVGRKHPTLVTIEWGSPTGVFVGDPKIEKGAGDAKDKIEPQGKTKKNILLPLRSKTGIERDSEKSEDPLLLPGTSIRGALRSRCSRIARTVLAAQSKGQELVSFTRDGRPIDVHEQLAADPNLVRYMFGTTKYRGAISVYDCETMPGKLGSPIEVPHIAIDRWTGGVVEGALFCELIYPNAQWQPIELEIDPERLKRNVRIDSLDTMIDDAEVLDRARASWCLLCLALAELCAGTLPLGGKTTRGLGQVEVTGMTIAGADETVINPTSCARLNDAHDILKYLKDEPNGRANYEGWSNRLFGNEKPDERNSDESAEGDQR